MEPLFFTRRTHSPLPLTKLSPPIHVPLLRYPLPPLHRVCVRLRHPSALVLCLSEHRHLFTSSPLLFTSFSLGIPFPRSTECVRGFAILVSPSFSPLSLTTQTPFHIFSPSSRFILYNKQPKHYKQPSSTLTCPKHRIPCLNCHSTT